MRKGQCAYACKTNGGGVLPRGGAGRGGVGLCADRLVPVDGGLVVLVLVFRVLSGAAVGGA
jgi:hypothetical protein